MASCTIGLDVWFDHLEWNWHNVFPAFGLQPIGVGTIKFAILWSKMRELVGSSSTGPCHWTMGVDFITFHNKETTLCVGMGLPNFLHIGFFFADIMYDNHNVKENLPCIENSG